MSRTLAMEVRTRWAARSVIFNRILGDGGPYRSGAKVCEVLVDGEPKEVEGRLDAVSHGRIVGFHTRLGAEVGPWGELVQISWIPIALAPDFRAAPVASIPLYTEARRPLRRRDLYPRIFISYRRASGEAYAGRLHEALSGIFGRDDIFLDQFSIRPGEVWTWAIQQAVVHAQAMIILIGPKWFPEPDPAKPWAHERDLVRREVQAALDRGLDLFPVLLPGAGLDVIPAEFRDLLELQVMQLTSRHWNEELTELVDELRRVIPIQPPPQEAAQ